MTCAGCGEPLRTAADGCRLEHRAESGDRYCTLRCAFEHGVQRVTTRHEPEG